MMRDGYLETGLESTCHQVIMWTCLNQQPQVHVEHRNVDERWNDY